MMPVLKLSFRLGLLVGALSLFGCAQYSTVSERRPQYRYKPLTPIGAIIQKALENPHDKPEALLGFYLDAASHAAQDLQKNPEDVAARRDYNFAISRVFEVIHDGNLKPWLKPVAAVAPSGPWQISLPNDPRPERNPSNYNILPADRYVIGGTYVGRRSQKDGIGAPLVASSIPEITATKIDRFAQGKHVYYGITALFRFEGRRCIVSFEDPLSVETVKIFGHTYPLAADFTAPIALALARENPKKLELTRLLRPQQYAETARLARLQPYDPNKIPVVVVHGLADTPATWTPMINTLRSDPAIRKHYQFWFYSYPSGYPYPYSASIMREELDAIDARYPDHKKMVLIGHSMGGCISRLMITDSGDKLWLKYFGKPPAQTKLSAESRDLFTKVLIFGHREDVSRVIFIAAPLRGSDIASNWFGRFASRLIHGPTTLMNIVGEARKVATLDTTALKLDTMPNSVDTLAPNNRFVKMINTIPITPGIPYNTICGDRGRGDAPKSSDGIVPYWSSHLDGAESELVVPSGHSAHQNPEAIAEVRRILLLHSGS